MPNPNEIKITFEGLEELKELLSSLTELVVRLEIALQQSREINESIPFVQNKLSKFAGT